MKNYKGAINLSLTYIAYNDCRSELAGPIGTNIITISMHWQKKIIEMSTLYDFHTINKYLLKRQWYMTFTPLQ